MKIARIAITVLLALAATAALADSAAQKTFDKLKSMEGTWVGQTSSGEPIEVTYHTVSQGSAIMSETSHEGMVTMYTLDGDRLLMTHYCGSGNQPRMAASMSPDGKTMTFNFVDATNLGRPEAGHMNHAVFTFADADHYSEQWTWAADGKNEIHSFSLQRKK